MKNRIRITAIVTLLTFQLIAQVPPVEWTRVVGGDVFDRFEAVVQTTDGGFLCVGETNSSTGDISVNSGTTYDGVVLKLTASGVIDWTVSLGAASEDGFKDVVQTSDGGFILAGNKIGNLGFDPNCTFCSSKEFWAVKISALGVIEWEQIYGSSATESISSVTLSSDGGYVFAGYTSGQNGNVSVPVNGDADMWIIKVSSTGTLLWERSVGGVGFDNALSVKQTADGGFITVGISENSSLISATTDVKVVKLSATGEVSWEQNYGNTNSDENGSDIIQTADGGYLVSASASAISSILPSSFGNADAVVFKIDALGTEVWAQHYGGTNGDGISEMKLAADGNYFIAGTTNSNNNQFSGFQGGNDAWVGKITPTGTLLWAKLIGGNANDFGIGLTASTDGGCVLVGLTNSTAGNLIRTNGFNDAFAVKIEGAPAPPADSDSTFTVSICGNSYFFEGTNYTESGTYFDTIPNQAGGDSLLILELTLFPIQVTTLVETTCNSYLFNGNFLDQSGNYTAFLQSIHGCDSTVTLALTVLPKPERIVTVSACESFTWVDGETYFQSTDEPTFIIEMAEGCDSILRLDLTITNPSISVSNPGTGTLTASPNLTYQWFDCETQTTILGATEVSFTPDLNGIYAVIVENNLGCVDTSDCYIVDYLKLDSPAVNYWKIFPNPTENTFTVTAADGSIPQKIEVLNLQGQRVLHVENQNWGSCSTLDSGLYVVRVYSDTTNFMIQKLEKR